MIRNRTHTLCVTLLALLLAACGGKTMVESDLGIRGAPDWVNEGTNFLKDKDGRLLHGVGSAPAMGNEFLQISTAEQRARAEIGRILSTYIEAAQRDYTAASGTGKNAMSQQDVALNIKSATKIDLSGAKIIGKWRNKENGTIYAIAELDIKYLDKLLGKVHDMNGDLKRYIADHGNNTFDRLSKEAK